MKKILKSITACALALVMTAISPMTDLSQSLHTGNGTTGTTAASDETDGGGTVAKAATTARAVGKDDQGNQRYISDIRIGIALGGVLGALIMYFSRRRKVAIVEDTDNKE